jgi:hypothetical protein
MATEILRPSGNVNALWAANSFSLIDEVVINPAAGGVDKCIADDGDESEEQIWSFPSLTTLTAITDVDVHIYHSDSGISGDPPVGVRIKVGGVWSASQNFNYTGTSSWDTNNYAGTWAGTDFDDFEIGVTAPGSIGSGREYSLLTLYAAVNGSAGPTEITVSHSADAMLYKQELLTHSAVALLALPGGGAQPFVVQALSKDEFRHVDPVYVTWANLTGAEAKLEFSKDGVNFRTVRHGNNGTYTFVPDPSDVSETCCFKVTIDGVEAISNEFTITDRRIVQYSGNLGRFGV